MFAFLFIYVLSLKALVLAIILLFLRVFLQVPIMGLPLGAGSGPGSSCTPHLAEADAGFSSVGWGRVSPRLAERTSPFSCTSLS